MSTIVVLVLNRDPWVLKLPHIHAGCAGELIQELSQLLQIVVEVMALLKVAVELLDLLLLLILQVLLALGLFLLLLNVLMVLRLKLKNAALSVYLLFKLKFHPLSYSLTGPLGVGLSEEGLCEIFNRVLGLGEVGLRQAPREDQRDLFLLHIGHIWMLLGEHLRYQVGRVLSRHIIS